MPHAPSAADPGSPGMLMSEELGRLGRLLQSRANPALASPGLEWPAYLVLLHLVKKGPQRSKSLAELMYADPSTVSRQASALVELGLVDRETDPADRRAVRLAATDAGSRLFQQVRDQRVRTLDRVLERWDAGDARALAELIRRFNRDLEAHVGAPAGHASPYAPPGDTNENAAGPSTQ